MALQSMTGFARAEGENEELSWLWEIRSVNGKGLDLRFRTPSGFESLEIEARKLVQKAITRGNLQVALQVRQKSSRQMININEQLIEELVAASANLQQKLGGPMPGPADVLGIKGVVETSDIFDAVDRDQLCGDILNTFKDAVAFLSQARTEEGSAIGKTLLSQVEKIGLLLEKIEQDPSREPELIKQSLHAQIAKLITDSEGFNEQRLHQEAVLLAAKADIQEEIDRLKVHVNSSKSLLSKGGAVGRKLDFLAQEFNRECNTICSKSNSSTVTSWGLDMKLVIDQFREQLQNME
ncbi:MAG: YicC/YloC family endoribonuclease [Pseudomonadota bacterium]